MSFYNNVTDANLLVGSLNFSTLISAGAASYGLLPAQAVSYAALHSSYASAFAAAADPISRTKGKVATKNSCRRFLIEGARNLAAIIQSTPTVTDEQKIDLGLTVRSAPQPQPRPTEPPDMDIVSVEGHLVKLRLHDSTTPSRRGRPPGASGAAVLSYVGETPSADPAEWRLEGPTTRTTVEVQFDSSIAPGSKVYLTAFWFNARGQGPACAPESTYIQFGTSMAA